MGSSLDRTLAAVAIALGATALAVAILWPAPADIAPPAGAKSVDSAELDRLRAHVAQLNAEVVALRAHPPARVETSPPVASAVPAGATPAADVAASVDEMRWTMTQRGLMPPTVEHLDRARGMIYAANSSIQDKLLALRILRSGEALSDDVVRRMIDVYHSVDDPRAQTEIIRRLDDVRTPALADLLLTASASSDNSRVRQAAVDSLSGFLPDPDLRVWLETVAQNDPNKRVQEEASRLLAKFWAQPSAPGP